MNEKQNKRIKSLASAVAVVLGIIALVFGVSKYVFRQNDEDKALNFNEYRVQTSEIAFSPVDQSLNANDYTGGEVSVTISPSILESANTGKAGESLMKIQYQITELGSQAGLDENNWVDYTGPFNVDHNVKINTRLVSPTDENFKGPVTEKDVTQIAVAKIGNTTYKTLADAITAWTNLSSAQKATAKIEMVANTTESVTIPANESVVLDLKGFTVTGGVKSTNPQTGAVTTQNATAITVNGALNLIDTGKNGNGSEYGSVTSPANTAIQVSSTGTLTLGTNESATSGNQEIVNINGPVVNGGTNSNGVVVAQGGTLNFYDGKITAPSQTGTNTAIVVNNTPVGESDIDKITTPNGYRLSIDVDTVSGREVATLVKTMTVSFDTNNGTPSTIPSIEVAQGKAYNTYAEWPSDPTREGYTFGGWNYNNETVTESTTVAQTTDHTLTAIWNPITYTISYNANTGTGTIANTTATYDTNTTLPDETAGITKAGYTLKGWSQNENADPDANPNPDTIYTPGQTVTNLTTTNNDTITLYAIWKDETAPNNEAPEGTSTTSTITVDFKQTDNGSGIDNNTIQYSIYKDGAWTDWQNTPTFENLTTNTDYPVKTRAKDNDGNGYTESQPTTIKTQQIQNATTTIHKDTATGVEITGQTGMINNDTVVLTVEPSTTGGTSKITVTAPDGTKTEYVLGIDVTLDQDGTYHITIPDTQTGTYTITTETTDGTNQASNTQTFQIDRTNPIINETVTTTTNSITVSANATDAHSGVNTVTYELLESDGTTVAQDANNQPVASNTTGEFTGLKDDHNYKVKITVTDNAGNTQTKIVDATTAELELATLAFEEATDNESFTPNTQDPNAQGSQVSKIWKNDDVEVSIATPGNGTTTYTYQKVGGETSENKTGTSTIPTENGDYIVTVTTTDGTNTKSQSYYFSIDKTAPTVAISPNGGNINIDQGASTGNVATTLTITEAQTDSGIASVRWAISNDNVNAPATGWTTETPANTVNVSATKGAGTYYIWTEVTDNAGNVSTTVKTSGAFNVQYVVEFDMNIDKTALEIIDADTIETTGGSVTLASAKSRNGYLFKGWSLDENATTASHSAGADYTVTQSTRFYAVWSEVVASTTIGGTTTYFDSVQDAIDFASTNEATVTLLKDNITESIAVVSGQNITLNTNGKTLTGDGTKATVTNSGTLTITGNGTIQENGTTYPAVQNSSILNIQGSTIDGKAGEALTNSSAGTVSVSGGTITSTTVAVTNNGTMNVTAGTISATGTVNDSTIAIVSNGTINISNTANITSNGKALSNSANGTANITGGTLNGKIYGVVNNDSATVNVSGNATITGENGCGILNNTTTTAQAVVTITGGTINSNSAGISSLGNGKFVLGTDDNTVNTQSPVIAGGVSGISSGNVEFYDGIIKAPEGQTINGTVTATPTGYRVVNGTEGTLETAYLDNHYTVTYNYNGATSGNTEATKTVEYGTAYGTLPAPEKTGYTFNGWKLNSTTITSASTVSTADDHTLTADWTANTYTLNFDANGGTVTPSTKDVTYDSTYGELPTPTRPGYTFDGWKDENDNTYTSTDTVSITEDTDLIAQWTANEYTVTFNPNGGTVDPTTKSVTFDQAYGTLPTPTKTGYDFNGWKLNNNTITASSIVSTPSAHTLTANWSPTQYTITYNYNGGAIAPNSPAETATYTVEDTVTLPVAEKTGYNFIGWKEEGADDNTAVTQISGATGNKNLVAVYTNGEASYKIHHFVENANDDGYTEESVEVVTILKGVTPETHVKTGDVITLNNTQAKTIANTTIEKVTSTLNGTNGGTVTVAPDSSTEIYVYYKRNTFNLAVTSGPNTKNASGTGTYKWGQEVDISASYANVEGYTYSNFAWTTTDTSILASTTATSTKVTMPAEDTTITATADRETVQYSITYSLDGGTQTNPTTSYTVENNAITLENPTKPGYTFTGWTGSNGDTPETTVTIPSGSTGNKSYTANWSLNTYTITYNGLEDATVSPSNPTSYTVESNDITLNNPTKTGYTFTGWTGSNGATEQTAVTIAAGSTGDKTYTANWTANIYKVTLNNQDATTAGTPEYYYQYKTTATINGHTCYYYTTRELTTPINDGTYNGTGANGVFITVPTKTGYTFNGYYTEPNGQGTKYINANGENANNIYTNKAQDTTLYAYWTINDYTVTYDYGTNGGQKSEQNTDVSETETVSYNSSIDLSKTGYKPDAIFLGWNTDSTASTTLNSLAMGTADVTLYAIYANMNVSDASVTIDLNGVNPTTQTITITGENYGTASFTSSDSTTASVTVDPTDANKAIITGLKTGTATITVTSSAVDTEGDPITKTITVRVIKTPAGITVSPSPAIIGTEAGYNTTTLTATIDPAGTTEQNTITWSSNNTSIATVDANTGVVTGVAEGTTLITARTANNITNTAEVIVDSTAPTIEVTADNSTYQKSHDLTITITDNVAGLPASQTIRYGWSTSASTAPTTWTSKTISVTEGAKTASTTVTKSTDTDAYYLWVEAGVKDRLNNATTANYVDNTQRALMDNTAPTIAGQTGSPLNANSESVIIIPLTVTDLHSGMNTGSTSDALTAEDIVVKVNGTEVTPATKQLTFESESNGVYTYSLRLTGVEGTGALTLEVPTGAIQDKATNPNVQTTINTGVTMDASSFTCTIEPSTTSPTNASEITYTFTFNKDVTGFTQSDIEVTNGQITSFTKVSDNVYTAVITNTGTCVQTVDVTTGSCQDISGNTLEDVEAVTMQIDRTAPTGVIVTVKAGNDVKGTATPGNSDIIYTGSVANTLEFSATDLTTSVVGYKVSTVANADYASLETVQSLDINALTAGTTYYVKAIDAVGNLSTNPTQVTVKLVTLDVEPKTTTVENEKTVSITATEENAGTVTWSSSDTSIATVSADGTVTAKKVGTVTITATASNDTSVTATSQVTVTKGIIAIPSDITGLVYNAQNQTGVATNDTYYTLTNNVGKDAGEYHATATLVDPTNYQWSDGTTTNKTIDWSIAQKPVTVTATASNKTYDGTTNVINPVYTITGVETVDEANVSANGIARFADKNVGNNKTINVTGIVLSGTASANYTANATTTTTANITKAPLTITYLGETITYGETPDMTLNKIQFTGFVNSETVSDLTTAPTITAPSTDKGTYTITPTGATSSNYDITNQSGTLTINAKSLTNSDIEAVLAQDVYTYNGTYNTPEVTVTDNGTAIILNTDYEVQYSDNKDAGTATVTITGKGNYSGTITLNFTINKAQLTATYEGESVVYNKETPALTVLVTGFVNGETAGSLTASGDYTAPTITNTNTQVGTYTLTPEGGSATNYNFTYVGGTLTITAPVADSITATVTPTSYNYDGTAKTPTVEVYDGTTKLVEGADKDYTLVYTDNIDAGTATVTINLRGNYAGTINKTFTINKINMSGNVSITGWTYGDSANAPTTTVSTTATKQITDYDVTYSYSGTTNAGVAYGPSEVPPTQAGNYTVTATVVDNEGNHNDLQTSCEFTIARATLTPTATANNKDYDGTTAGTGTITLTGAKYSDAPTATGTFTFTSASSNNNTPQTVNVTNITLDPNYTANYVINPTSTTATATINTVSGTISNLEIDDYTYGDSASTPVVESDTNDDTQATYSYLGTTASGESYGPTSTPPTDAGTYTVTVTLPANENYNQVSDSVEFTVNKRTVTPSLAVSNKTYDGNTTVNVITQTLTNVVNNDDVTLVVGTAPTYSSKDVGTYTVTFGNMSLAGTKASNYQLSETSKSMSSTISKKQLTATYQGQTITYGQTPDLTRITVTGFISGEGPVASAGVTKAEEYIAPTVTNSNTAVGTYPLTPAGGSARNYSFDYVAGNLVIQAKSIGSNDISAVLSQNVYTYDGTEKEPTVTVTDGANELTEGTDYKVTYTDNVDAGTATVTIEGMGNYSGTRELTFTINKVQLTVNATADVRPYNGTTNATGTVTVSGGVNNETPTLKQTYSFEFDTANAGTNKTVYVTGIELDNAFKKNYQINSSSETLTNGEITKVQLTVTYPGETIEFGTQPSLQVQYSGFVNNETKAVLTTEPTVSNSNTALGRYTLTPEGGVATNYSFNYVSGVLNIVKKQANVTITLDPTEYTYDGTFKEPTVTVVDNGTGATLVKDTDYTVNYLNNKNAGTATVEVTLIGNFDGEAEENFTINKATMAGTLTMADYTYSQTPSSPELTITTATAEHYTTTYSYSGTTNAGATYGPTATKPTNAGTYTVTATVVDTDGNHNDLTLTANFTVDRLEVAVPTANTNLTYTGNSQTGVTKVGSNYTISGNTGTNAGNYTATVTLNNTNDLKWVGLEDGVQETTIPWSIAKVQLTPSVTAEGKVYDGTTTVTNASISLTGAVNSELPTATATYAFDLPDVGTRTVTASDITLGSSWTTNYELTTTTAETTAEITKKAMTVNPVTSYSGTYDGNAHGITVNVAEPATAGTDYEIYYATVPLTSSNYTSAGSTTPITRTNAGDTTVYYYVKDLTGNYSDYASNANNNNGTISISKIVLTPSVNSVASKEYDATTQGSGTITLSGAITGENPTATGTFTFEDKNVGTGKTVNVTGIALTGSWATNYELSDTSLTSTSGIITAKTITATLVANDKDYDRTTTATGTINLTGVISGDTVTASATSYTFDSKNAGNRTVTASTITLSGADAGNYVLSSAQQTSLTDSAVIRKIPVTIDTITAQNKEYDGTTSANGSITLNGVLAGDTITATGTFNFENKNAGNDKTVNVTNIALSSTTNYTLSTTTGTASANITKKELTATYVSETVKYGGTPNYLVEVTGFIVGEGEEAGDGVNKADGYVSPTVTPVSNPTVSGSPYTLTPEGGAATNYSFTNVAGTLTVVPDDQSQVQVTVNPTTYVYDGTEKEPAVTVVYGGETLTQGTDYTVQYTNNINVGTATATVTLIGNYDGTGSANYTITKADGIASVSMAGWTYGETPTSPVPTSSTNGTGSVTYEYYTNSACTTKTATSDGAVSAGAKPSNAGTYYVKATFAETTNYKQVTATTSFTIAKKEVTVSSASVNAKTYDGTTEGSGTITLQGGVNSETPTATGTFIFDNKNAGTGKTVSITGISLDSAYQRNYVLNSYTYEVNTGVINKVTLTATYLGETITYGQTPDLTRITVTGFVNNETAEGLTTSGDYTAPTVTNSNTAVGTYTLTPAGGTATNYEFNNVSGTLTINAKALTSEGVTITPTSYTYDGTAKTPTETVMDGTTTLVKDTDYTVEYENNIDAGTGRVIITGIGNYSGTITKEFTINKADMTLTKTNYTGTYNKKSHAITISDISSDDVTIYYSTSTALTSSNYATSGTTTAPKRTNAGTTTVYYYIKDNSGNYNDYASNAKSNNGQIKINKKSLTPTATADNKVYDGTTDATGSISLTGIISGDTVTASATSYTFASKDAGNGKTVTASGITLSGANAGNYSLSSTTATTTANITKRTITPSATANNKVYDGTTSATGTAVTVSNAVTGESPVVTATYAFANATVGNNKNVTVNYTLNSSWTTNYSLSKASETLKANITPATLTATYLGETIAFGETPSLTLTVTGFVNNETAGTAAGYVAPTLSTTATAVGTYTIANGGLTKTNGSATNYVFEYNIGTLTINANNNIEVTVSPTSYTYDGTAKEPTVTVRDTVTNEVISSSEYDVSYSNNVNAGNATAVATVTFKAGQNHTGTYTANFTINKADRTITATTPQYVGVGASKNVEFTYNGTEDATATVTSSATEVATASMTDGNKGGTVGIVGVTAGTANVTITVPASDNYNVATKVIAVTVTDFTISPTSATIAKDGTVTITPTISPASIANTDAATTISWVSGNTGIATVSSASTTKGGAITVTGVANGTATITATLNGQTRSATIIVQSNYAEYASGSDTPVNYYVTLAEALAGVGNNNTIKPLVDNLNDASSSDPTLSGKTATFDLNGKTVTMSRSITNQSTLNITGAGTLTTSSNINLFTNTGTLNLSQTGTISNTGSRNTVENTGGIVNKNGSGTVSSASSVYVIRRGTVNISNGTILSTGGSAIATDNGFTMSNGTVKTESGLGVYIVEGNALVTGGTIEKDSTDSGPCFQLSGDGTATLRGGNILVSNAECGSRALLNYQDGTVIIDGTNIETRGTGNCAVNNADGTISVLSGTLISKKSTTLLNNATGTIEVDGGTIRNIGTITTQVSEDTQDEISEEQSGFAIRNVGSGDVVIESGTVESVANIGIHNDANGNIVVHGGTISGTAGIKNNTSGTGSVIVTGGTIIGKSSSGLVSVGGTVTLGVDESANQETVSVSITEPCIRGYSYGLKIVSGNLNFYDGVLKGRTSAMLNQAGDEYVTTQAGYEIVSVADEVIDEETYHVKHLGKICTVTADANGGIIPATTGWTVANEGATATKTVTQYTPYGTLPTPTKTGYTFAGWKYNSLTITNQTIVPTGNNHTITAQWTPSADTAYVVNHYVHDLGTNTYSLDSTDNLTGTTDETLTLANLKKTISGFTYEAGYLTGNTTRPTSGAVTTTTVSADGSRVINLYYRRNYLYINYHINGGTFNGSSSYTVNNSIIVNTSNNNGNYRRGVYGSKVGSTPTDTYLVDTAGLHDYNSANFNITKTGFSAIYGAEWNTRADGTGTSYSQSGSNYNANDMAQAAGADLSAGDAIITLYVNWAPANYGEYEENSNTPIKYYNTLADAFSKATSGNIIKPLVQNPPTEVNGPRQTKDELTLEIPSGYTITLSTKTMTNTGTLTITGDGTLTTSSDINLITNTGTLYLNQAGTISNTNTGTKNTVENTGGTVYKTGTGTVSSATSAYAIRLGNIFVGNGTVSSSGGHAIAVDNGFTMTNGKVITTSGVALNVTAGNATVSGGRIEKNSTTTGACLQNNGTGTVTLSGGTIINNNVSSVSNVLYNDTTGTIIINGADVETKGTGNAATNADSGTIRILSGSIKAPVSSPVYNSAGGRIEVKGGTIKNTGNEEGGFAIRNVDGGTISVEAGTVEAVGNVGIRNDANGSIEVSGGTVKGTIGIQNETSGTGSVTVTGGNVIGTTGSGIVSNGGTVTLGVDESANQETVSVSITDPCIRGYSYGLNMSAGNLYFYDGVLKGKTAALNNTAGDQYVTTQAEYSIISGADEVIEGNTYHVKYLSNVYTVTVNANGGTIPATTGWTVASGSATATKGVTYGTTIGTLPTPTKTDYVFEGWYTEASGGSSISSSTTVTGNVTYYAHWRTGVYVQNNASGVTVGAYDTLNEAFADARAQYYSGGPYTIKVLSDKTETTNATLQIGPTFSQTNVNPEISLDLNGHNITFNNNTQILLSYYVGLNIKGSGKITGYNTYGLINNNPGANNKLSIQDSVYLYNPANYVLRLRIWFYY